MCPVYEMLAQDNNIYMVPLTDRVGVKVALRFAVNAGSFNPLNRAITADKRDLSSTPCVIGIALRQEGNLLVAPQEEITSTADWLRLCEDWQQVWAESVFSWVRKYGERASHYEKLASREDALGRVDGSYFPWPPRGPKVIAQQMERVYKQLERAQSDETRWAIDVFSKAYEQLRLGRQMTERQELLLVLQEKSTP